MTAEEYWSEEWHAGRSIVGLIVQEQVGDTAIEVVMMPDNLFNTMERFAALKTQDVAEDILDIIDSENSGLSAEGRLDEIKADMKRVINQTYLKLRRI